MLRLGFKMGGGRAETTSSGQFLGKLAQGEAGLIQNRGRGDPGMNDQCKVP